MRASSSSIATKWASSARWGSRRLMTTSFSKPPAPARRATNSSPMPPVASRQRRVYLPNGVPAIFGTRTDGESTPPSSPSTMRHHTTASTPPASARDSGGGWGRLAQLGDDQARDLARALDLLCRQRHRAHDRMAAAAEALADGGDVVGARPGRPGVRTDRDLGPARTAGEADRVDRVRKQHVGDELV